MIGVTFTAAARSDLRDIALRIAEYSFRRSISYVDEIETRCRGIADFLRSGAPRPQWGTDVRMIVHGKYLVVYRSRDEVVQILRIVHGARDLDALFADEPLG